MADGRDQGAEAHWPREKQMELFKNCFAELKRDTLDMMRAVMDRMVEAQAVQEKALREVEGKLSSQADTVAELEHEVEEMNVRQRRMQEQLEELGNRRQNVRIVGLPEGCEGSDAGA
ncbi:hypothetical protein scyTo_0023666, partial [Scyliorhinus torazame]|nr:hypothetical protein [Scyliorhinus torazame]